MNQISIKSSAHDTPEVKIRRKIRRSGKKLIIFNARIIHDDTSNKEVSRKVVVQFSVNYETPFSMYLI